MSYSVRAGKDGSTQKYKWGALLSLEAHLRVSLIKGYKRGFQHFWEFVGVACRRYVHLLGTFTSQIYGIAIALMKGVVQHPSDLNSFTAISKDR